MSAGFELHLDYAAIGGVLRSPELAAVIGNKADEVAANVPGDSATRTFVSRYTTDRAAASVTVVDWSTSQELKYGDLFDAAGAAGLEVHRG